MKDKEPGSGEYKVKEIPFAHQRAWCKLTLPDAKTTDKGVYEIKFPKNGDFDTKKEVIIKPTEPVSTGLIVSGSLVGILALSLTIVVIVIKEQ